MAIKHFFILLFLFTSTISTAADTVTVIAAEPAAIEMVAAEPEMTNMTGVDGYTTLAWPAANLQYEDTAYKSWVSNWDANEAVRTALTKAREDNGEISAVLTAVPGYTRQLTSLESAEAAEILANENLSDKKAFEDVGKFLISKAGMDNAAWKPFKVTGPYLVGGPAYADGAIGLDTKNIMVSNVTKIQSVEEDIAALKETVSKLEELTRLLAERILEEKDGN